MPTPRSRFQRPTLDSAVAAWEERVAPLLEDEPADPAGRRRVAARNDDTVSAALGITPLPTASEEHTVPVDGHPGVRIRVYWPGEERAPAGSGLPVLVYYYGGGFTIAGIDWVSWDARFRVRARDAGIVIVAADYAHAPEQRFPAQPEQCWSAFEWTRAHAEELGASPERMAVGGASSGGDLAAAVTLMNRDRSAHPIVLQLLENPALDLTMGHADMRGIDARMPGVIVRAAGRTLVRQYLGEDSAVARLPYASPLRATSHERLPPALILTSELDPLRGDGEAYARALSAAGVPVTAMRFIGQTHGSLGSTGYVPAADVAHRLVVSELRTLHARGAA
ncbi:esterase [Microbacterium sp. Root1433D1]|uniref:alpha/beta hydrolase n=1 Tax=Microbacterium sp. Root1433D1 TaxID=1736463 RepID=UPI0006FA8451|nr:alpha/beta hydrolase [Microbacterium sp. Root1433D1]KQY77250.1 esterase [Microbacterium sp. Root1433D1]